MLCVRLSIVRKKATIISVFFLGANYLIFSAESQASGFVPNSIHLTARCPHSNTLSHSLQTPFHFSRLSRKGDMTLLFSCNSKHSYPLADSYLLAYSNRRPLLIAGENKRCKGSLNPFASYLIDPSINPMHCHPNASLMKTKANCYEVICGTG